MGQFVPTGQPLEQEMKALVEAMQSPNQALFLTPLAVAPLKPRDGMLVMANGTNWNPGSGAGFYGYRAGSWRFLG
jgi:hypothetical protein